MDKAIADCEAKTENPTRPTVKQNDVTRDPEVRALLQKLGRAFSQNQKKSMCIISAGISDPKLRASVEEKKKDEVLVALNAIAGRLEDLKAQVDWCVWGDCGGSSQANTPGASPQTANQILNQARQQQQTQPQQTQPPQPTPERLRESLVVQEAPARGSGAPTTIINHNYGTAGNSRPTSFAPANTYYTGASPGLYQPYQQPYGLNNGPSFWEQLSPALPYLLTAGLAGGAGFLLGKNQANTKKVYVPAPPRRLPYMGPQPLYGSPGYGIPGYGGSPGYGTTPSVLGIPSLTNNPTMPVGGSTTTAPSILAPKSI